MVVRMTGRKERTRRVSAASVKPFYIRPRDLRHPLEDEFAQQAWRADLGRPEEASAEVPLYTLTSRQKAMSPSGTTRWEYQGRYPDGAMSNWLTEHETLKSFIPLQLDTFHALVNLYAPSEDTRVTPGAKPSRCERRRQAALETFPLGTRVSRTFLVNGEDINMRGQVVDYSAPFWRIRYYDGDWEEYDRADMTKFKM